MTAFAKRVAEITGVSEERLERLAGGDLSEVLLVRRPEGHCSVAKGGPAVAVEAAMLRALAGAGVPVPAVEGEYRDVLLIDHVENDGVFSPNAWADIGDNIRRLHGHAGDRYGWPADFLLGTIELDNRRSADWPSFWAAQRLQATAAILDLPWRERVDRACKRLSDLIPATPPAALLHGDLWGGNILVNNGQLAALVDPACYHGHAEVDLAMLKLFGSPPREFWDAYGALDRGWEERRNAYQLFPALVHLRLFGSGYAAMVDRLLKALGA